MGIDNRHLAMLALDEFIDHTAAKWAGAVEGEHGDYILEAAWPELPQILAHSGTFNLEDAIGIAPRI